MKLLGQGPPLVGATYRAKRYRSTLDRLKWSQPPTLRCVQGRLNVSFKPLRKAMESALGTQVLLVAEFRCRPSQ